MKDKNIKYTIIGTGSDFIRQMWADTENRNDVNFVEENVANIKNQIINKIFKAQYSYKMFYIFKHCGKRLWRDKLFYSKLIFSDEYANIVIFTDLMPCVTDSSFWKSNKKKFNLKTVLLLLNSCYDSFKTRNDLYIKKVINKMGFDLVLSFDIEDCKKFGFAHFDSVYSTKKMIVKFEKQSDSFFVGKKKDRLDKILSIYEKLQSYHLKNIFYVTDISKQDNINDTSININQTITYNEVLDSVFNTKFIIDISSETQSGMSLKYFEAVVYNKKLITTNKNVKKQKYYNPNYMLVINNSNEISEDFINDNTPIDYGYKGDYSPNILLDSIKENL